MGCKLQEAAAKYQYEGFSRIYIACAGTDMQKLIDLLETMFGEMDIEDIDLSEMETETTRDLCKEVEVAEAASSAAETGVTSKDKIMRVYVTSLPVPLEFGIPSQNLPETESIKERSTKNPAKKVTKFYYTCCLCPHSSQNKASMMTHTQRCLNIKLICDVHNGQMFTMVSVPKRLPPCLLFNIYMM